MTALSVAPANIDVNVESCVHHSLKMLSENGTLDFPVTYFDKDYLFREINFNKNIFPFNSSKKLNYLEFVRYFVLRMGIEHIVFSQITKFHPAGESHDSRDCILFTSVTKDRASQFIYEIKKDTSGDISASHVETYATCYDRANDKKQYFEVSGHLFEGLLCESTFDHFTICNFEHIFSDFQLIS